MLESNLENVRSHNICVFLFEGESQHFWKVGGNPKNYNVKSRPKSYLPISQR